MIETQLNQDLYLTTYDEFEKAVAEADPTWLHQLRQAAMTRFKELGFPGKRSEDWKYTPLAPLLKVPFQQARIDASKIDAAVIQPFVFADALQLVFVNGYYSAELSNVDALPAGLILANLRTAIHEHGDLIESHLARFANHDKLALTALNTAFLNDGAFISVRAGAVIDIPIHIIHVSTVTGEPTMAFPRCLVIAEKSSHVTLVESYVGLAEEVYFNNAVMEVFADANAVVDHYKVVRESNAAFHIANMQVHQERDSNFSSHYIALTGGMLRNEARTVFQGENGECTLNGLFMGHGRQHIDNFSVIDHAVPHCNSHELYKGVLDDKSRGVFSGKIYVRPDAQKTDAKQTNQCILLSDDATIDTKPQLEIFADDVKCTHGATVGQLDKTALFYLRSRGIGMKQARSLLLFAFANDIIQRIKVDAIRAQLEDVLLTRQQLPKYLET